MPPVVFTVAGVAIAISGPQTPTIAANTSRTIPFEQMVNAKKASKNNPVYFKIRLVGGRRCKFLCAQALLTVRKALVMVFSHIWVRFSASLRCTVGRSKRRLAYCRRQKSEGRGTRSPIGSLQRGRPSKSCSTQPTGYLRLFLHLVRWTYDNVLTVGLGGLPRRR